nr:FAD-dependent oxidoreductase [Macrococcus carouselicus]
MGAGVIGMSIARNLPGSLSVAIIDRNQPGQRASYAAGGMLGAQNEFYEDNALYRLSMAGRAMMPEVIAALESETGHPIHFSQQGLIKYLSRPEDIGMFNRQYQFLSSTDSKVRLLQQDDLKKLHAGIEGTSGIYIPDDGQIDAACYTMALKASLAHIDFYEEEVISLTHDSHYRIRTDRNQFVCEKLLIAGGAWSQDLLAMLNIHLPVSGMRGEVCYMYHPTLELGPSLFGTNGCYIVPKHDHHYLIGATSHPDRETFVSDEGKDWLLTESSNMIPALKDGEIIRTYSGVRPFTENHALYLDECRPGLYIATGHYRNGILLSAITGRYMAELIQGRRDPVLNHFKLKEFTT